MTKPGGFRLRQRCPLFEAILLGTNADPLPRPGYRIWMIFFSMAMLPAIVSRGESVRAPSGIASLFAGNDSVRIVQDEPTGVTLEADGPPESRGSTLRMTINPPQWALPRIITPSFYFLMNISAPDATVIDRLARAAHIIMERDDGSFGFVRKPFHGQSLPRNLIFAAVFGATLAAILLGLRMGRVVLQVRPPHLIPAAIQTSVLAYWWLYWPGVGQQVPSILLQIVLAYAVDAIISLLKERTWRVGLGPLPIVLSANLFAWFSGRGAIVVIVAAVASRAFIRRGGRHILNPSAAGLTLGGLLSMASPDYGFEGVFHTLNLAPNMAEVLILLALIPQIRFRIVLVSVGAVVGLILARVVFRHYPALGFPGTLIAFALFATDPATVARTPVGQLLFGAVVGAGMAVFSTLLTLSGYPDDLSKVFPVPIANMLVHRFDVLGERLASVQLPFLTPRWNLAHVALWLCLVVPAIWMTKPAQFLLAPHWTYTTPLVVYRSADALRCEDNPIFCRLFTFPQEISQWTTRESTARQ